MSIMYLLFTILHELRLNYKNNNEKRRRSLFMSLAMALVKSIHSINHIFLDSINIEI